MLDVILANYPEECTPDPGDRQSIVALGNAGGFSGAALWRLKTPRGRLCLRQWPRKHPRPDHLTWMHSVLIRVADLGCSFVPAPISNSRGNGFVLADGHLWELTPWMPGEANYKLAPSPDKLHSAMTSLARFHLAAATVETATGKSRAVQERSEFAESLDGPTLQHLQTKLEACRQNDWYAPCRTIVGLAVPKLPMVAALLKPFRRRTFRLQPCIRDIWHDHLLFTGEVVTGLIDFGAMRIETVACDLARLLGSLIGDDLSSWELAIATYEDIRSLTQDEKEVLLPLHRANVVLAGLNWVRWLAIERRVFEPDKLQVRLDEIVARLSAGATKDFRE